MKAVSLKTSAKSRYRLHSATSEFPSLCAKRIVASRPMLSWMTVNKSAAVGEAVASPTPTPKVCGKTLSAHRKRDIGHLAEQPERRVVPQSNLQKPAANPE
jgi:hypothetical protein